MELTTTKVKALITEKLDKYFATSQKSATPTQMYKAVSLVIRDILLLKKQRFNATANEKGAKKVYYLCMEFLLGRSLRNNLYNLGLEKQVRSAVRIRSFPPKNRGKSPNRTSGRMARHGRSLDDAPLG